MSIHKINQVTHLQQIREHTIQFNKGDIIRGRIIQLFPNQMAKIQIGSHSIMARLEAPLVSGKPYFFQVEQATYPFHLKVFHLTDTSQITGKSVQDLLRQLGITPTKEMVRLASFLFNSNIPIQKQMLIKAHYLLSQSANKRLTMNILKQMIIRQLPIKPTIFQALKTHATRDMNDMIKLIINQPEHALVRKERELIKMLKGIVEYPVTKTRMEKLVEEIRVDTNTNNKQMFLLLKVLGVINKDTSFQKWQYEWLRFFSKQQALSNIPFRLNEEAIFKKIDFIVQHKEEIQQTMQNIVQINESASYYFPKHMSKTIQSLWMNLTHHSHSEQDVQTIRQMLSNDDLYNRLKKMTQLYPNDDMFLALSQQKRFMNHMNQVIHHLGLTYEHQFVTSGQMKHQTVKGLLLKIIESGIGNKELYQNLLNMIHGTQILSLHETNQIVNILLQVPAEKLGLIGSLKLDITGNKKADGKLDEEFCRILFYLNLPSLHTTVIDMFIQQRTITLTIYNHKKISHIASSFEVLLKKALKKLDYQLSHIAYKSLNQKVNHHQFKQENVLPKKMTEVDYRI